MVKATYMNIRALIPVAVVAVGLTFGVAAQAGEKKHHEQSIRTTDVPAAVQQAAETEAKGGKIIRWEKEGANYEAVIEKGGKQWGVEINSSGKVLNKHDESKEHKEKKE